ncbi:acyl-CoA thioesterase [Tomitella gaofuii]|uniref:acyl-CoA thioesterase n=1 Tax=Tomitella gaofuii TaxID=2760083 RepID=UPI0015FCCE40|nr:acyl-CoA thioesterase II [Tomitella gaofuii]
MTDIRAVLDLERLERDIYRGPVVDTLLKRTFGGQVAGQALVAAERTVDPRFQVHSLHANFLRPGNPAMPTVYLIDRVKDGRSFCMRRVSGVQDGETIFAMSASFHVHENGLEHQDRMPDVTGPEELPDLRSSGDPDDGLWFGQEWGDWDLRMVPAEQSATSGTASRQRVWMRHRQALPDDPVLHICALAYMSDMTLLDSAKVPHRDRETANASLDHAMWFLRPFRADEWLLYDQTSPSAGFGRALTQGRIFTLDGRLAAAVVQEGLMRPVAPGGGESIINNDGAKSDKDRA